jgi:pimeloyl-ACP methyl ester carboxylesterase
MPLQPPPRVRVFPRALLFALLASLPGRAATPTEPAAPAPSAAPAPPAGPAALTLEPCRLPGVEEELRCGTHHVPENRRTGRGRQLPLRVVVLPARAPQPGAEPLFVLSGGPGQAATDAARWMAGSWERQERDVVLMDLRGTGEGHRLDCPNLNGSDDAPQGYLEPLFSEGAAFRACRQALERRADLTQYTTPIAMQDLDALRRALGYGKVHLMGGSYGTRAAIVYLRMFGEHVRSAVLSGLSPLENRAPLFHAAAAQRAFDEVARQCDAEAACKAAYPTLREDLGVVLARLRKAPARVQVPHPVTGAPVALRLSASAFGDGLRVQLYSAEAGRKVPLLLQRARAGDLAPFALAALQSNRGLRRSLALGLLLSVTCAEDVARIRPGEVARETAGSFIGDFRVRGQMQACAQWPKGELPADYARPFRSEVPALLVSGNLDPVTPPQWGEVARRTLPDSLHVVNPGGHGEGSECLERITAQFLRTASVQGLDASCIAAQKNPPFVLPGDAPGGAPGREG